MSAMKEGVGPIPGEGVGVFTFGHNDRTDPLGNMSLHNVSTYASDCH